MGQMAQEVHCSLKFASSWLTSTCIMRQLALNSLIFNVDGFLPWCEQCMCLTLNRVCVPSDKFVMIFGRSNLSSRQVPRPWYRVDFWSNLPNWRPIFCTRVWSPVWATWSYSRGKICINWGPKNCGVWAENMSCSNRYLAGEHFLEIAVYMSFTSFTVCSLCGFHFFILFLHFACYWISFHTLNYFHIPIK